MEMKPPVIVVLQCEPEVHATPQRAVHVMDDTTPNVVEAARSLSPCLGLQIRAQPQIACADACCRITG